MKQKPLTVALVGNPNSGKSSLFNLLTGLNQKISNFPGTTVDRKTGMMRYGQQSAKLIDLPGIYSLFPKSADEKVSAAVLMEDDEINSPDLIVAVIDASNLKRNMLLFTQVADLQKPMILALNMLDLAAGKGISIDIASLSRKLGIGVVAINARENEGIAELQRMIFGSNAPVQQSFFKPWPEACQLIESYQSTFPIKQDFKTWLHIHYQGEGKPDLRKEIVHMQAQETIERYRLIDRLLKNSYHYDSLNDTSSLTYKLDRILTHRYWGFISFFLLLLLMFQAIFSWSSYPMELIEQGFSGLGEILTKALPPGFLTDMLVNGVVPGLSGVVVFLPQIVILYTFIAILEDTGYMSRVSFIMDRMMRRFGLNGKSVVPLISGIACAVPAIMATRTIENRKDRLITIFVTPLMSCSARLPVFTLLISLFVPAERIWGFLNLQGLMLMLMYLLGFVSALVVALVMKHILKLQEKNYLIMEMPQYRKPRWKSIGVSVLGTARGFLWNAGKIIVAISMVLWFLASYGPSDRFTHIEEKYRQELASGRTDTAELKRQEQSEKLAASYAGEMGRFIEPAIKPLGFNWKIGIALVSSVAAREVFVGTMATIYSVGGDTDHLDDIRQTMLDERDPETGEKTYNMAVALSLLIFYAFAMQCMSTIAVVHRETKTLKWPTIQFLVMTGMAYAASFIVYQLFR